MSPSSPPGLVEGLSESRETHHLGRANVVQVHHVSSHVERSFCVLCLQLLLIVWADRTIGILPDDVFLHVFHFVRVKHLDQKTFPDELSHLRDDQEFEMWRLSWWHPLVHVCRGWRSVIFASPIFLDLKLVCGHRTRVESIGIWPPLPIVIRNEAYLLMPEDYNFDAAVMHRNRVCEIHLYLIGSQLQQLAAAMQEQFPALIHLALEHLDYLGPSLALPDGFLGGYAPHLQHFTLYHIPFPALPKLLLSATNLVYLALSKIPHSGYISPEVIVTAVAVLANLETLIISFESPLSRPNRRQLPPTRVVLSALNRFTFRGVSEYLEDLVAQIETPLLDSIRISFFNQLIFDIPRLSQFMRTTRWKPSIEARVDLFDFGVWVKFFSGTKFSGQVSVLTISSTVLEWQLSSLAQLFTSFFPTIHMVEHLYIDTSASESPPSQLQDDIENMQWQDFSHPFTAVKNIYVCEKFVQCIAPALQELVGERATDVLPALENLFLEGLQESGPVREAIEKFIAMRQLLGYPITVSLWRDVGP